MEKVRKDNSGVIVSLIFNQREKSMFYMIYTVYVIRYEVMGEALAFRSYMKSHSISG